jgi:hypothetical protein
MRRHYLPALACQPPSRSGYLPALQQLDRDIFNFLYRNNLEVIMLGSDHAMIGAIAIIVLGIVIAVILG